MSLKKHFVLTVGWFSEDRKSKASTEDSDVFKFQYRRLSWQFSGMWRRVVG